MANYLTLLLQTQGQQCHAKTAVYTDLDRHGTLQIGSLQQRHAEVATAVEQLNQQTNAAQQALIQALQAEGTAAICIPTCFTNTLHAVAPVTTSTCLTHSLQAMAPIGNLSIYLMESSGWQAVQQYCVRFKLTLRRVYVLVIKHSSSFALQSGSAACVKMHGFRVTQQCVSHAFLWPLS